MKTVARISLVALLLAGFAAPASAAPTTPPPEPGNSPTTLGKAYNDWCLLFPPAPACSRSKFWS